MTVPNQNIIIINRDYPQKNFLQIKNENWQNMLKNTNDYYAFALYLYLACNKHGFKLELSPAAIKNAIGLAKSTYYTKLDLLKNFGYIRQKNGNTLEFYETPQTENLHNINEIITNVSPVSGNSSSSYVHHRPPQKPNSPYGNREIYITHTNNNIHTPPSTEAEELKRAFGFKYP